MPQIEQLCLYLNNKHPFTHKKTTLPLLNNKTTKLQLLDIHGTIGGVCACTAATSYNPTNNRYASIFNYTSQSSFAVT